MTLLLLLLACAAPEIRTVEVEVEKTVYIHTTEPCNEWEVKRSYYQYHKPLTQLGHGFEPFAFNATHLFYRRCVGTAK